jgi:acetyl-CoA carboxylase carboxyl transferase subunit beta
LKDSLLECLRSIDLNFLVHFAMSWLTKLVRPKIRNLIRKETPSNLWHSCPGCQQLLFYKDVEENLYVCQLCQYHMVVPVEQRIAQLLDAGSIRNIPLPQKTKDLLKFKDRKRYSERLKEAQQKTKEPDALRLTRGTLGGYPLVMAIFNFNFIGGSMGAAVGEGLVHGARMACQHQCAYMVITSSGGARMQEGIFSLMQMPRSIIGALMMEEKKLPFLTVLAHPTTGGVAASFAFLGDVVLAEPGAIIGFTGARVIQETTGQKLPSTFQTAEFQEDHGMLDCIVPRSHLKEKIALILGHLMGDRDGTSKV